MGLYDRRENQTRSHQMAPLAIKGGRAFKWRYYCEQLLGEFSRLRGLVGVWRGSSHIGWWLRGDGQDGTGGCVPWLGWGPVPRSALGMPQGSEVTRVTPTSKQTTPSRAKNRSLRLKIKSKDVTERCCWKAGSVHPLQTFKDRVSLPEPVHL